MQNQEKTFKVVIVGDGNTGKTAFINRLLTGNFSDQYTPTVGVEIHPLKFTSRTGKQFTFNCFDCAGKDEFGGLRDDYYLQADAFIVFATTEENTNKWLVETLDSGLVKPDTPCVLVSSKTDIEHWPEWVSIASKRRNLPWVAISTKNNDDMQYPFNILMEKLDHHF